MVSDINSAVHLFQAALTPAFLLTGTGITLSVISARLSSTIGRTREVYRSLKQFPDIPTHREELAILDRCCLFCYRSFLFCACSALFTCTLITFIFAGHFLLGSEKIIGIISWLFITSTSCLTIAIFLLVYETVLSKKLLFFTTRG